MTQHRWHYADSTMTLERQQHACLMMAQHHADLAMTQRQHAACPTMTQRRWHYGHLWTTQQPLQYACLMMT